MNQGFKTVNENGVEIQTKLLGCFIIPELEKEFAMYSIVDNNPENSMGSVLLGEIVREEDGTVKILDIKKEEGDMVVAFYNEISTQIGE